MKAQTVILKLQQLDNRKKKNIFEDILVVWYDLQRWGIEEFSTVASLKSHCTDEELHADLEKNEPEEGYTQQE